MKIIIKATNVKLTNDLRDFINKKIGSLERFVKRFEKERELIMRVEVAQESKHHKKGEIFFAECNLQTGKKMIHAVQREKDIEIAINRVKDKMKLEIKKFKEKMLEKRKDNPQF